MRPSRAELLVGAMVLGLAAAAGASTLPAGFQETAVVTGLTNPTAVRFAANGQVFVAEKSGRILVYDGIGDPTPTEVADLSTQVHNFWDRGLLGLAVDPDFPVRPYLYALYTHDALPGGVAPQWGTPGVLSDPCPTPPGATADGCVVQGRLSRIDVDPITMQGAEVVLLEGNWCQQYPSHSVGDLAFGSDGMLYASAGDGASFNFVDYGQDGSPVNPCGDPGGANPTPPSAEGGALRSQDLLTPADPTAYNGSVLRIDVSNPAAGAQVPTDNPLVGNGVADDDFVIAHGLRNPFRLASRPGTSEIWIAEVGWNTWEEINRIQSPTDAVIENFGWPCFEGGNGTSTRQGGYDAANLTLCENLYAAPSTPLGGGATDTVTASFFAYRHDQQVVPGELCGTGGSSATGAAFYQGGSYPPGYADAFFFADSTRQCIWTMFAGPGGVPDPSQIAPLVSNAAGRVVDVQIGPGGDLFYVDFDGGRVFRVRYFVANEPPTAVIQATPSSGPAPLLVQLDGSGSSDPEDGANLQYAWDLDGNGVFDDSSLVAPSYSFASAGSHLVSLRVTDTQGESDVASLTVTADNTPPLVEILSPAPDLLWAVGDEIAFSGRAIDPQDGELPPANLSWSVLMHHCATPDDCHTHPIQDLVGIASGSFAAPDHEYPSYLELRLTATDFGVGDWWDAGWAERQKLTFDNSAQAEALDGFPVLVLLDPTRVDYGQIASGGADLRFVDPDGTPLPHEIESWNEAGVSAVWVRVPRVEASSANDFVWMYYGNAAAADAQDAAAVWAGYAGVWHLDSSLADSTGNGNDGTDFGTTAAVGEIGGSRHFDGAGWIDAGAAASLALAGDLTLEAWIAIDDPGQPGAPRVLSKKPAWSDPEGYNLEYHPLENNLTSVGSGSDYARADAIDLDTGWHGVGSSISGGTGHMYVDGVDRTTDPTLTPVVAGTQSLRFGREQAEFFMGRIDEIRVAPVARSAAWMAAQFLSMSDAFVSFGSPEPRAELSGAASLDLYPTTVTLHFATYPTGLELGVGPDLASAPFDRTVIVGSAESVSAPSPQPAPYGGSYDFQLWSDGGAQSHNLVAPPAPTTFTAFYLVPACADGVDNDRDGAIDFPDDPGCSGALATVEGPACDDDRDNDGDGTIDWDGGSAGAAPDPQCAGNPQRTSEGGRKSGCGLGFELAAVVPLLEALRRRRRGR
jgi:glucose/arabinose dehydrogenase/PKD repeat protein